jgi:alkylated DNA repair dioxygenase AlkB
MLQLEKATRMARTLGKLTGDPVPNYGEQDFLVYQVRILKRQVDMILMRQAMAQEGIEVPSGPVDDLILGFVERVGVTKDDLAKQMIENSVERADLDRWFDDSRASNIYIQQHLMPAEADPTDDAARKAAVDAWLEQKWETSQILIEFYDPETLGIGSEGG